MRTWSLALCAMCVWAAGVRAEDPKVPEVWKNLGAVGGAVRDVGAYISQAKNDETVRLVRALGAAEFAVREKAVKDLIAKGIDAFPGLLKAAEESRDDEVIARVENVLGRWRGEVALPASVVAAIQRYDQVKTSLVRNAARNAGRMADPLQSYVLGSTGVSGENRDMFIRLALAKETDPQLITLLQDARAAQGQVSARVAIAEGRFDDAQRLLKGNLAGMREPVMDYVALAALRRGDAFDPESELQGAGLVKDNPEYRVLGMLLFRAKGDLQSAGQFAAVAPSGGLYSPRQISVEKRDYKALSGWKNGTSIASTQNDEAWVSLFAGDSKGMDALRLKWLQLIKPPTSDQALTTSSRGFLMLGEVEDAVAAAKKINAERSTDAFHWLCQQLRIREALATLKGRKSIPLDVVDHLLELGLTDAARRILDGMDLSRVPGQPAIVDELSYAAELERVGEGAKAEAVRTEAFRAIVEYEVRRKQAEAKLMAAEALEMATMDADIVDMNAVQQAEVAYRAAMDAITALSREARGVTFNNSPLFPDDETRSRAQTWNNIVRNLKLDAAGTYELTVRIMKGNVTEAEAAKLIRASVEGHFANSRSGSDFKRMAEDFHAMHHDDWVVEMASQGYAREGDPACFAILGDIALENGQPETAFLYYRRVAEFTRTDGSLAYRMGLALARGHTAVEAGKKLMELAPFLVLGDPVQQRALATAMRRFEGAEAGDKWEDDFLSRFGRPLLNDTGERFVRARDRAAARGDWVEAVACQQQVLLSRPQPVKPDLSMGMAALGEYQRLRALEALSRKDMAALADALWRAMDNGPPDVELLEKAIPVLRAADGAGAAKIVGRAVERLGAVVEDYPGVERWAGELKRARGLGE